MTKNRTSQTIHLRPLTGPLNPIASADELLPGEFAWKEEMAVGRRNRLARRNGFDQFADTAMTGVVHLAEVATNDGVRRLVSATEDGVVSTLSSSGSTWRQIGSGMQNTGEWSMDTLGNNLLLSDGNGRMQYALLPDGDLADVPELNGDCAANECYDISGVSVVIQFSGCMFLMNFVEDGTRITSRVRWGALADGLSYLTAEDSVAGFQDLPYNQKIINAGVLGNRLLIYTDSSIWVCRATGSTTGAAFAFEQLYTDPRARTKCLAYRNSLITVGSDHVYLGVDGVYAFNAYQREPLVYEWLDNAAQVMFDQGGAYALSRTRCTVAAGFDTFANELWLSWSSDNDHHTLIADVSAKTCDFTRRGWRAFVSHTRSGQQTFDDWFNANVASISGEIYDTDAFALLCDVYTDDLCGKCGDSVVFIGSLRADARLKVIGYDQSGNAIRKHIVDGAEDGFVSVLRGVVPAGNEDHDKVLSKLVVEVITTANHYSNAKLVLRTGITQQAMNPNDLGSNFAGIQWSTHAIKPLGPSTVGQTMDNLEDDNLLRTIPVEWNLFERGRFIYWEVSVVGADGGAVINNSAVEFSRVDMDVRLVPRA